MPVLNTGLATPSRGGFTIDQSLRFEDGDNAYLSFTPSSTGNRKTWTWSGWIKRCNLGSHAPLFSSGEDSLTTNQTTLSSNQSYSSNSISVVKAPYNLSTCYPALFTHIHVYISTSSILVGGQAVMEGVMMRVPGAYATAVRDSEGKIQVDRHDFKSVSDETSA